MLTAQDGARLSELDPMEAAALFVSSGALMFKGFRADTEEFISFSDRFGGHMSYAGGTQARQHVAGRKDHVVVPKGPGEDLPIPGHGEMHYRRHKPCVLWFYCQTPATTGGQTTVYDGRQVFEHLRDTTKELFLSKKIKNIRTYPEEQWADIYQTDDLESIERMCEKNGLSVKVDVSSGNGRILRTEYVCSAVTRCRFSDLPIFINNIVPVTWQERAGLKASRVRFEDDSRIPDSVVDEAFEAMEKVAVPAPWESGDVLMVDNLRMLHGRWTFTGKRRLHQRLCDQPIAELHFGPPA